MTEFDPELVALFREETHERISRIFVLLGDMRGGDGAIESQIEELNRELHTIKGSVKMLGFHRFGTFVHELENLTPALVNDVSGAVLELFEECADEIAGLTDACVSDGEDRSPRQLLAKLRAALEGEGPGLSRPVGGGRRREPLELGDPLARRQGRLRGRGRRALGHHRRQRDVRHPRLPQGAG